MPITQKEIAKRLNLGRTTVTQVLNGSPNVWVSAENREKILTLARELNYRPNPAARALRDGRFFSVVFAYVRDRRHLMRYSFHGAIEVLAEQIGNLGYELRVRVFSEQAQILKYLEELTATQNADAVILWGEESHIREQGVILEEHNIPFMVKGRFEGDHPQWCQVDFDHEGMMSMSVDHLASLHHRRIAYIGAKGTGTHDDFLITGYCRRMESLGYDIPENFVALYDFADFDVSRHDRTAEFAQTAMERWLELPESEQPTALVIGTGSLGWHGVEAALIKSGKRIGEGAGELAVCGVCSGSGDVILTYGQANAFQDLLFDSLAEGMFKSFLLPVLSHQNVDHSIVRILPELKPLTSLNHAVV